MLYSETDPESYITEYTLICEDKLKRYKWLKLTRDPSPLLRL